MIRVTDLVFRYRGDEFCLQLGDLNIASGEQVAIVGPSGSGKTTLLHILSGILQPEFGLVSVMDRNLREMSDRARRDFRAANVGLVFQEFELIEYMNVLDNILLTYRINDALKLSDEVRGCARKLADKVGIKAKLTSYPGHLSQGEKQRVAICRAILAEPALILADEPTGNLDAVNKQRVLDILLGMARDRGATLLTVTHDHGVLDRFDRVIDLADCSLNRDPAGSAFESDQPPRSPLGRGETNIE